MKSNTQRFYEWLKMTNNIYINNPEMMVPAIRKVALNNK